LAGGLTPLGSGIQSLEAVFLLLLVFVAVFAGLARQLKIAYPILLVIAGLALSLVPGMPRIGLDPNLVFLVFLPPLLYSAAWMRLSDCFTSAVSLLINQLFEH